MKIITIEANAFAVPLPRHFNGSNYTYTHKKCIYAKATTEVGIEGFVYLGDDFGLGQQIANSVNTSFRKILLDRVVEDTESLWQDIRPLVRDILGDRRVALHAQALLDILCWDLRAKSNGVSVIDLIGRTRNEAPMMAIAGYYTEKNSLSELAHEVLELKALGCLGMKLKVGGLSIEEDVARVRTVRETAGDEFHLAVDANQAWTLRQACDFVARCEPYNLYWIEEPVHWDNDIVDLANLRRQTSVPVCAGQSETTVAGIARLIDAGAVDICNLHPGYSGGITPWLKAAKLAKDAGLKVANTGEPQLSSTLMLAMEHGMSVEIYHPDRDPLFPSHCPVFNDRAKGHISGTKLTGWGIVNSSH